MSSGDMRIEKAQDPSYRTFFMLNSAKHEFSLLINMKMPTIVGIFIFISRENFMLSYILQETIVAVSNLRFISQPNFMLSWVEHEKSFITSGSDQLFSHTHAYGWEVPMISCLRQNQYQNQCGISTAIYWTAHTQSWLHNVPNYHRTKLPF